MKFVLSLAMVLGFQFIFQTNGFKHCTEFWGHKHQAEELDVSMV